MAWRHEPLQGGSKALGSGDVGWSLALRELWDSQAPHLPVCSNMLGVVRIPGGKHLAAVKMAQ